MPSSVAASSFAAAASSSGSGNGSAALLLHCAAAVLPATAAPLARAQLSWAAATHGGLAAACDAEAVEVALAAVAAAADALCAPPSVAEASDAPSVPTATLAAALASLDARGESLCAAATATGSSEAAASAMSVRARGHDVRARLLLALSSAAGDNDDAVTSGNVAAAAAAELRAARRYWQAAKVVLVSPSQSQALTVASATGVLGSRTPPRQASSASGSLSPSANRLSIRRTASPAVEADSETVAMDPAALLQQTACAAAAAASVAVADEAERELASRAAASAAAAEDDSALVRRLLAPLSSLAPPVAAALAVLPPSHFILWATERGLSGRTDEAEAALLLAGRSAVPQSAGGGGGGGGGGENCSARLLAVSRLHGLAVHVCARRGRFAAAARLLQIALRLALPSSAEEAAAAGGDASLASTLVAGINAAEAAESVAIAAAQARFLSALEGPESVGATPPATCPAPAPRALPSPWPLRLVVALAVQHLRSGAAGAAREALEWAAAASPALAASPLTLLRLAECSLAEAAAASATAKGSLPGEAPPASPYTSRFASDTQTPRSGVASGCGGSGPTVAVTQREDLLTQEPPPPSLAPPLSLPATATTDVAAVDELAPVPPSCAGKVALVRARALLVRCLAALRAQQAALPAAGATSPRNTNPCAAETLTSLLRVSLRSGRGVGVGIGGGAGNNDGGEGISVGGNAVFETPQEPDGSGDAFFAPSPPDESPSPLAVHMLASGAADVVPIDAALPAVAASAASSAAAPAAGVFLSSPARLRRLEAACMAKLAWTQLANGEAARAARTAAQLLNGPVAGALTPDEAASARAVAAAAAAAVEAIALG